MSKITNSPIYVSRGRKTLVQAFILCRLDHCNSLFYGITEGLMSRLYSLSRMRLNVWCRALDKHIAPMLQELHCFQFDVGWISRRPPWSTYHCPAWLQLNWLPTASWSPTKIVVSCFCHIEDVYCETNLQYIYGDRCFAAAGPKLWSLPTELRQADISFQRFKRLLKNIFVRVLRSRHIVIAC